MKNVIKIVTVKNLLTLKSNQVNSLPDLSQDKFTKKYHKVAKFNNFHTINIIVTHTWPLE